jgi:arginase family enzyme
LCGGAGIWGCEAAGACDMALLRTTLTETAPFRYDNAFALKQIEEGHNLILSRPPKTDAKEPGPAKKGKTLPRVITLGGDHTITLPLLRSINRAYGPVSVIHFDSHL